MKNKSKYDFSNGFISISSMNETMELEKYLDKLFLIENFNLTKADGTIVNETIRVYTAKKYDKNDETLKRQKCERCGNLSNSFIKIYLSYYGVISSVKACPYCQDTEYGFMENPKFLKLYMKGIKYKGKAFKKLKRRYKKFLKENKKMLKL